MAYSGVPRRTMPAGSPERRACVLRRAERVPKGLVLSCVAMRIETQFVRALTFAVLAIAAPVGLLPEAYAQSGNGERIALPDEAPGGGVEEGNGMGGMAARLSDSTQVLLGEVHITGLDPPRLRIVRTEVAFGVGEPFDPLRIEADIGRVLSVLEREGLPLATASVQMIGLSGDTPDRLAVTLHIVSGPEVVLRRLDLEGAERTRPRLVTRLAGMKPGMKILRFDAERLRRRIEGRALFQAVGLPVLRIAADTSAVVRIPIEEGPPGAFDLVLGYLPPSENGERGSITGSGHLALRNPFGRGLATSLRLNRLPDQVSSLDVSAAWPFAFGFPLGLEAGFSGLEEDSTYGKRAYRGELNYDLASGMKVFAGFSRESTAPGQAGVRIGPAGRQVAPMAKARFLGLGVRLSLLDHTSNPSQGFYVEMNLESGRKERTEYHVVGLDTLRSRTSLEQQRLYATGRWFTPVFSRSVVVLGVDASVLLSSEYDRSDLFRFGGAATLRGYDEDRFLGRIAGRALVEYRILIDAVSYAYGFFDLGYVDRPETPDLQAIQGIHPGYGVGIRFETAAGIMNMSAALNPESGPGDVRIHAGVSFGL